MKLQQAVGHSAKLSADGSDRPGQQRGTGPVGEIDKVVTYTGAEHHVQYIFGIYHQVAQFAVCHHQWIYTDPHVAGSGHRDCDQEHSRQP